MLESWRYLAYTIALMAVASFGNLWLTGAAKYALLVGVLAAACLLFRSEIRTLWKAAGQILAVLLKRFRRGKQS